MQLTPEQIDVVKALFERMTIPEIASELSAMLGRRVSRSCAEKTLSLHGIYDPKRAKVQQDNEQIKRFWCKGEPSTIAEFVGVSMDALRMRVKRMRLSTNQIKLPL